MQPWLRALLADPVLGTPAANVIWNVYAGGALIGRGFWRDAGFQDAGGSWFRPASWTEMPRPCSTGSLCRPGSFIGLARREGWKLDYTSLRRESLDGWGFELQTDDNLYPGAESPRRLGLLRCRRFGEGGWKPSPLGSVPAVTLSEALRSADLLASTAAFALDAADLARPLNLSRLDAYPVSGQTSARRIALQLVLAAAPGFERISFGDRCLTVRCPSGDARVHFGTGFVVEPSGAVLPPQDHHPLAAIPLPWLAYDKALLELVVRQTVDLLGIATD